MIEIKTKLRKRVMVCVVAIGSLLCLAAAATGTRHEVYEWDGVGWVLATDDEAKMSSEDGDSQQFRFFSSTFPGSSAYVSPEAGNPCLFLIKNVVRYSPSPCEIHPDVNPFIGGQDFDNPVGEVSIWNDDENLYVKCQTNGWYMTETQLYVGTTLPSPPIKPGKFPYKHEVLNNVLEDTYIISLSELGVEPEDSVYILVHAVVDNLDTGVSGETAWKEGTKIEGPGAGWAMYHKYLIR